jgi:hypothetical protein
MVFLSLAFRSDDAVVIASLVVTKLSANYGLSMKSKPACGLTVLVKLLQVAAMMGLP